jgi:hypothetical protein
VFVSIRPQPCTVLYHSVRQQSGQHPPSRPCRRRAREKATAEASADIPSRARAARQPAPVQVDRFHSSKGSVASSRRHGGRTPPARAAAPRFLLPIAWRRGTTLLDLQSCQDPPDALGEGSSIAWQLKVDPHHVATQSGLPSMPGVSLIWLGACARARQGESQAAPAAEARQGGCTRAAAARQHSRCQF